MSAAGQIRGIGRGKSLPEITGRLRDRIIAGQFERGERLPSCRILARDLKVSHTFVHRALGALARDGFVTKRPTRRVYVSDLPPHLFRYGIIFQSDPAGGERNYWPPSWRGLNDLALQVQHMDPRRQIVPYYNITGHKDVSDYQRLLLDVRASRLAGLIFVSGCAPILQSTLLFADAALPRVMLYTSGAVKNATSIGVSDWAFIKQGLDYLARQGRKRIAVLDGSAAPWLTGARLTAEIQRRGMTTRSSWLLPTGVDGADRITQLLMSLPVAERPDGLFVVYAFLLEHALAGLVAADVRVPRDLEVVAAANFPCPMRAALPVKLLGTDLREGLCAAIELIDRQRRGETVPAFTETKNIFEEDLPATDPLKSLVTRSQPVATARIGHNVPGEKS